MELFDFWAFQNFMKMLSHDKIIFHMLFWAFHITPRTSDFDFYYVDHHIVLETTLWAQGFNSLPNKD